MKQPLSDRVIIEPIIEETSKGGIIIPENARQMPKMGKVVAVGIGKPNEPMTVKVGDTVIFPQGDGAEVVIDDKDYLIMRESDILAIYD